MEIGRLNAARASVLIALVVFAVTAVVWQLGGFEPAELWIYDQIVLRLPVVEPDNPDIVIVAQTESDIDALDYPMRDRMLASVLDRIEAGGPAVIGLDLYRDLPEPRDRSELPLLNAALARDNIVAIFLSGNQSPFQVPPPPALGADPTRCGFNNFFTDGKAVRRACLSARLRDGKTYNSFASLVATYYLSARNVDCGMEGGSVRLGKTVIHRVRGSDGGYANESFPGYQFLVDFRGPRTFRTYTLSQVLALNDPQVFRNKIVLIGSTAASGKDNSETPLDPFTPGIVVHAQIIDQLLRIALHGDRPTETASAFFRWLSLAVVCLAGALVGFRVRSHLLFAAAVVLGAAAIVSVDWALFTVGYWTIIAAPLVGFIATTGFVKAYAARHEEMERANLMKLFSQHISPTVAQQIWEQRHLLLKGGRPEAQRLTVTALFTDLKNYSAISEKMSPAELIAWVNDCTGALAQHVGTNGGFISSYMGDGMMAVFGVPVARTTEDEIRKDAISAVRCALAMANEIHAMNATWRQQGKPEAGLRVGIFTGEAMAGVLGSQDHLEYSVIGDTVNTASRLESVDKEGQVVGESGACRILIGERTWHYVKDSYKCRDVGRISLKGKGDSIVVYKVLDQPENPTQPQEAAHENLPHRR
jgi:CHASE2 domain-containing sensor protein/class 3 adenylate cyclase